MGSLHPFVLIKRAANTVALIFLSEISSNGVTSPRFFFIKRAAKTVALIFLSEISGLSENDHYNTKGYNKRGI